MSDHVPLMKPHTEIHILNLFDSFVVPNAGTELLAKACRIWLQEHPEAIGILHPTEQKYPEQTRRFRELLEEEYQTHLAKNADYSSWNINATGIVGLVVRFWDKCARIMNLAGFDIGTGQYTGMKKNLVEDETIIDTFRDAGVYAKIARIYSEGKWGK